MYGIGGMGGSGGRTLFGLGGSQAGAPGHYNPTGVYVMHGGGMDVQATYDAMNKKYNDVYNNPSSMSQGWGSD